MYLYSQMFQTKWEGIFLKFLDRVKSSLTLSCPIGMARMQSAQKKKEERKKRFVTSAQKRQG